jgi:hypothetical protein
MSDFLAWVLICCITGWLAWKAGEMLFEIGKATGVAEALRECQRSAP